jgi:hypothetical protein
MHPYEFLTKDQEEQIHAASMRILQEIGIDFRYPPALEILKKGGAKVDGERVFFPAQLVEAQIKKAPAEFTLYARNSDCDVVIGGSNMAFTARLLLPIWMTAGGKAPCWIMKISSNSPRPVRIKISAAGWSSNPTMCLMKSATRR